MKTRAVILGSFLITIASSMLATSFVVPTDQEMVARSNAIVVGTVEGSFVQEVNDAIETVYEVRVDRSIKGSAIHDDLVRVVSPGGVIGDRGLIVPAAAHFEQGERVLLFLTREKDRWVSTDMTLGKFRFVTSTAGDRLLVRDLEDVVGWDRAGQVHHEKVRREEGFLRFLESRRLDPVPAEDYTVDVSQVTLPVDKQPATRGIVANAAPFPAATYTSWVSNQPVRWPNISAGVVFYKRVDQNIAGAADGGVSTIQNGLASWTNECGSVINLIYGGTSTKASTNFDGTNVVEYNDPQNRISGSWTGSGTVAVTFLSFSGSHTFLSQTWLNISDADVVFQNGFTASSNAFAPAMTHELGHGIGWRHSNQSHLTGGACDPSVEECTSAAIMNSSVVASYGFTLQPWDINAAQSVYPGGSCGTPCTPPSIATQPTSRTIASGGTTTLSVSPAGTAPFTYQWYVGTSGNTASPVPGGTGSSLTVTLSTTTSYWVRVSNACGSANSASATVTVTPPSTGAPTKLRTDFNGDGRSDIFQRNPGSGASTIWFMNGTAVQSQAVPPAPASSWTPSAFGDLNGDGRSDIFWRNSSGANVVWLMNGASPTELGAPSAAAGLTLVSSGDYNGDGRLDLFWRNTSTGANQIWYMNGAAASTAIVATIPANWQVAGSGDFDGDGRFDVMWRDPSTFNNVLWLMKSTGTQEIAIPAVASDWFIAGTGDFNADGRSDLFWRNASTGADAIWLMNGATRTEVGMPTVPLTWTLGTIGDFNADGQYDVAWHNVSGSNAMWLIRNAIVTSETALPAAATGSVMYGTK
jgi:FG-GAP-like repeat/Ig-like domain CHU_C associated